MRGGKWLLVALGATVLAVLDAVANDLSPVIGDERSLGDGLLRVGAAGAVMRRPGIVGLVAGLVVAVGALLGVTVLSNWGDDLDAPGLTATALLLTGVAAAVVAVVVVYLRDRRRERTSHA